ncbi:ABC transporter substrate-binding protein [soil metagenome]
MFQENPVSKLNEYYQQFLNGEIDRRKLLTLAGTLGLAAPSLAMFSKAVPASAQDASPAAVALPGGFISMNREEYKAMLAEDYPFVAEEQTPGGTLIMGQDTSSNLTTTNAFFAANFPTQDVMLLVYDSLVGLYPKGGATYVPALADYFEIAEDGKTYTFHLNQNATFHDGTPVTADDILMVADAQANENSGSSYTSSFLATVESWEKIDDHTLQLLAVDVFPQVVFFSNVFLPVLPKHIWGDVPVEEWQSDPGSTGTDPSRVIGSGPFKFVELNESEGTATFARNEDYYDDVPAIETLIFQVWPDTTASVEALRADQVDFLMASVPPSDVESLQAEENIEVSLYDTYRFGFYAYNLDPEKTTLFQEVEVRQALIYAIDRQSIVDNIYLGYGEVANGTQPTLSEAYAPDEINTVYNYDPEKATEMLDAAGWVEGSDGIREKDGQKLSFEIMYGTDPTNDQIAAALQHFWSQVGVEGQPTPVDFDTVVYPAFTENFNFQIVLLGFNWASPSGDQSALFGTEFYGTGLNAMKYSNPEFDELTAAANRTANTEERRSLLIQASNIVNEDVPASILLYRQDRIAYNVRMENFTPTANGLLWSLPYVDISE